MARCCKWHHGTRLADRVDLIIGKNNLDTSRYGTAFENVRAKSEEATVYELEGQGHSAHIQAPGALSFLIDTLAGDTTSRESWRNSVSTGSRNGA
jgi:hypothetical protein